MACYCETPGPRSISPRIWSISPVGPAKRAKLRTAAMRLLYPALFRKHATDAFTHDSCQRLALSPGGLRHGLILIIGQDDLETFAHDLNMRGLTRCVSRAIIAACDGDARMGGTR